MVGLAGVASPALPSHSGEVHAVTVAGLVATLSMKICCRGTPPTEVKSPITRSSVPPWLSDWL